MFNLNQSFMTLDALKMEIVINFNPNVFFWFKL